MSKKTIFLLDAYALIYRSYFAFMKHPRFNSKGLNTSAAFGFLNTLIDLIQKENPKQIVVAFDINKPTFRHEIFEMYKANREKMPEEIRTNIPYIKQFIESLNIPICEKPGFEADDIIGTLAKKAENDGKDVFMMTPDKDYGQLVSENIKMYKPRRFGKDVEILGIEEIKNKYSIKSAEQLIDILALWGDAVDNIPGAPGIGEKTAIKLISQYGSIEGIYDNIDKLKGKQKENLIKFKEQVELSKVLAKINVEVPVEHEFVDLDITKINFGKLSELCTELEFRNIYDRIKRLSGKIVSKQPTLFDTEFEEVSSTSFETFDEKTVDYKLVENAKQIDALISDLQSANEFAFDTETTSLNAIDAQIVGMSFSFAEKQAYYVTIIQNELSAEQIFKLFKPILEDPDKLIIGQNLKYDILVIKKYDINIGSNIFDTMIGHYLVQPEMRHNIDILAENYLNYYKIKTEELIGKKGVNQRNMKDLAPQTIKNYACEDADVAFRLKSLIKKELVEHDLLNLFNTVEIPLVNVLASMEYNGVSIDIENLKGISDNLRSRIIEIEKSIFNFAGQEFNIASPKQLGEILFDKLKIVEKPKLTKTKQYATGEEVLKQLVDVHQIVPLILEFRSLSKLFNTYVDALPKLVNSSTNRIHSTYNQAITSTGRLSSSNPNLQNIPIRDDDGKIIRKAFVPYDKNYLLLSADYSQIELRIMAHFCQDETMIKAFENNIDIHTATAARLYHISESEVSKTMRSNAKSVNFGIIYGISAFGLSQNTGMPRYEAKNLIEEYFNHYPKIKSYMESTIDEARKNGYSKTILGRKRFLPDINSQNGTVRAAAERNAINAPIQGSSADMIKLAMIDINKQLLKNNFKSKLIIQVHDEVILNVLKTELEDVKQLVIDSMMNAIKLDVKLKVDVGVGSNWLEAH